jgi:hypothetical protein
MFYKKLNFNLSEVDYEKIKGRPYEGYGETFRQFYIKDVFYLYSLIRNKIKFKIKPNYISYIEISGYGAEPHKDQCLTTINYYIDVADCVTTFYRPNTKLTETIIPGMTGQDRVIEAYQLDELVPVDSFKAVNGDAYLLNSRVIHSVLRPASDTTVRKILKWTWDRDDFETVLDSIEILDQS